MKKPALTSIFAFLFSSLLVACGKQTPDNNQGNNITVLEGEWRDQCTDVPLLVSGAESSNSVIIFSGNKSTTHVNEYTDDNCSIFLRKVMTVPSEVTKTGDGFIGTFEIGDMVTTRNGVDATQLHYHLDSGIDFTDLFLLQNNNTTLILGKHCPPPDIDPACPLTEPNELNFSHPYTIE